MYEKVLVTGGKGFLGQHIVQELRRRGKGVCILTRPPFNGSQISEKDVIYTDIRDKGGVEKAAAGFDAIFHLASNFREAGSDKKDAYAVNVEGTENILQAALKQGVKKVVHCSTIGVHGDVKVIPANEETPFNPGDMYQETKMIGEQLVWDFYKKTGLPISVVRPISLMGPGDERMLKLFKTIKKGHFVMIGNGEVYFQPAYIDDVVKGFMLCLEKDEAVGEAFIIGSEEYVPLKKLVEIIAEELGVKVPKRSIPLAPVLAMAHLCESVCVPLGIEPPLHRRRVSFFQNNRAFYLDKAKRLLNYQPEISLREGIRRTINWYEEKGWL
jgi:dihydroflavonol-4-reductase